MLKVSEELFLSHEVAEIKNWLSQAGAAQFKRAIGNAIAKLQIEASEKFYEGLKAGMDRRNADGEHLLLEVKKLQNVLDYLDHAQSKDFKPFVAKIVNL